MGNTQSAHADRRNSHRLSKPRTKTFSSLDASDSTDPARQFPFSPSTSSRQEPGKAGGDRVPPCSQPLHTSSSKTKSRTRMSLLRSLSAHSSKRDRSVTNLSEGCPEPIPVISDSGPISFAHLSSSFDILADNSRVEAATQRRSSMQASYCSTPRLTELNLTELDAAPVSMASSVIASDSVSIIASSSRPNASETVYAPLRRRSLATPGVATRQSPDFDVKRSSYQRRSSGPNVRRDCLLAVSTPALISNDPFNDIVDHGHGVPIARSLTPSDQDYGHTGAFKLGTLRVVNGRASPAPSCAELDRSPESKITLADDRRDQQQPRSNTGSRQSDAKSQRIRNGMKCDFSLTASQPPPVPPKPSKCSQASSIVRKKLPSYVQNHKSTSSSQNHKTQKLLVNGSCPSSLDTSSPSVNGNQDYSMVLLNVPKQSEAYSNVDTVPPANENEAQWKAKRPDVLPISSAKTDSGYSSSVSLRSLGIRASVDCSPESTPIQAEPARHFDGNERPLPLRPDEVLLQSPVLPNRGYDMSYMPSARSYKSNGQTRTGVYGEAGLRYSANYEHLERPAISSSQYIGAHKRQSSFKSQLHPRPSHSSAIGRVPVRTYDTAATQSAPIHNVYDGSVYPSAQGSAISQYWDDNRLEQQYGEAISLERRTFHTRWHSDHLQKHRSFDTSLRRPVRRSLSYDTRETTTMIAHAQSMADIRDAPDAGMAQTMNGFRDSSQPYQRSMSVTYSQSTDLQNYSWAPADMHGWQAYNMNRNYGQVVVN